MSTPTELNAQNQRPKLRKWLQMGVELEGAWDKMPNEVAYQVRDSKHKHDGSVKVSRGYNGEIVTKPHARLDDLIADVTALYPQYMNETCGLHIHTSFTPLDTSVLADGAFWKFFRRRWEAWGTENNVEDGFWDRFHQRTEKARRYCKSEFKPEEQLRDHNDRYTMLNFTAWHKYKTLECRFLPVFKSVHTACLAIRELSDIYDTYLNENPFPEIELVREVSFNSQEVIENYPRKCPNRREFTESIIRPGKRVRAGKDIYYHTPAHQSLMLPWAFETDAPAGLPETSEEDGV